MNISEDVRRMLLVYQKNEINGHHLYRNLATEKSDLRKTNE